MNVPEMCRKLVDARGNKTQREVAKAVGISASTLAMYEGGDRVPRDDLKEKIAEYYGMSVGFLFFNEKVHI